MSDDGPAAFYRRYNAYCNEHRFEDFGEFVTDDVVINDTARGLDAYVEGLRVVVGAFPDFRWELRHLAVDEPWGVRRFFVRDPHGVVLSVLAHE